MNRRSFLAAAAAAAFASATLLRAPEGEAKSDRCGRRTGTTVDRPPQPNARRPTQQLDSALRTYSQDHLEISAMDLRLLGKRALVTGSSIGLGEAIARALAAEGVAVAIHGRQPKRTYAVAADIEAHGGRVAVVLGDLTVEGEAQNIADSAIEQLGGIDILVNNAGGILMRSRTLSSSCAVRLPVTSPGRTCESMVALYQLC